MFSLYFSIILQFLLLLAEFVLENEILIKKSNQPHTKLVYDNILIKSLHCLFADH